MPRFKKAGRKGHSTGGAFGGKKDGNQSSSSAFERASTQRGKVLTLAEEAQNTGRQHNFWETDQKLRHTKVNFISAGALDSSKPKKDDAANLAEPDFTLADMTLESTGEDVVEVFEESEIDCVEKLMKDAQFSNQVQNYFFDTQPGEPVETGFPMPLPRASTPTPSDSSEEVILFGGRDENGKVLAREPKTTQTPTASINHKIRVIEDRIHQKEELLDEVLLNGVKDKRNSPFESATRDTTGESSTEAKNIISKRAEKHHRRNHWANGNTSARTDEDALIADYIANIDKEDAFNNVSRRDLGGTGDEFWLPETEVSSGDEVRWNRDEIRDFDNLSTSDGIMGEITEVLSKRIRPSGLQYLVVWDDQVVDEARWVLATTLSSVNALSQIDKFKREDQLAGEFMGQEEESSDDYDDMSDDDMGDDEALEEDLISKKVERMSDAQIAKLLAKQEELGMGSEEILLFDDGDDDSVRGIDYPDSRFKPVMLTSRGHGTSRRTTRPSGEVSAAGIVADPYDGFDVLDFDRPSLKRKPKGRKGKLELDISDSELEQSMMNAWDNDRLRKKERKQQREDLRAQGLLGSKNGKPDLKQKYKEGMGIYAVRDEIKQFLMGNNTTLSLPPMEKSDRKVVHELANAFKLKSKSDGSGKKRHPILHKTQQTRPFFEQTFNAVEARISRRFLPRMDVGGKKNSAGRTRTGGGFSSAAVSYRDGDVVGGSAPELGAENRGRAMLEKMGWSNGTALGALNNKGILQPVSHVVKTTKAGLG